MCEFKVFVGDRLVFEDVVYAREEGGRVILRDVLGERKELSGCRIVEVDVQSTRLVLAEER